MGFGVPVCALEAGTRAPGGACGQRKAGTVEVGTVAGGGVPGVRERTVALRRAAEGGGEGGVRDGCAVELAAESVTVPASARGTVAAARGAVALCALPDEFVEEHPCGTGTAFEVNSLVSDRAAPGRTLKEQAVGPYLLLFVFNF